jgi:hypothetical protein
MLTQNSRVIFVAPHRLGHPLLVPSSRLLGYSREHRLLLFSVLEVSDHVGVVVVMDGDVVLTKYFSFFTCFLADLLDVLVGSVQF